MRCGTCGHAKVKTATTTVEEWHDEKLYVVRNVPVERCPNCGEEYFAPDVVEALERLLNNPTNPEPITAFALEYA